MRLSPAFAPQMGNVTKEHALGNNLLVYYPMNEGGGRWLLDRAGRYSAQPNTTLTAKPGFYGNCFKYDGTQFTTMWSGGGFGSLIGSGNFSVSLWVRPTTTTREVLIGDWNNLGSSQSFTLEQSGFTLPANVFGTNISTGGAGTYLQSTTTYTLGQWYHLVVVRGSINRFLYVNGRQEAVDAQLSYGTGNTLTMGRAGAYNGIYTTSSIANVAIWNRALTAGEVAQLYAEPYALMRASYVKRLNSVAAAATTIPTARHIFHR